MVTVQEIVMGHVRNVAAALRLPINEHWQGIEIESTPERLVVVMPMIANWRIIEAPPGEAMSWRRAWCYGDGPLPAIMAAIGWVKSGDDAPVGWVKSVHEQRYADGSDA